jgi:ornithine cyclodeaminase/alanine dehydrogenase-like protein (mu-crystallin family)
MPDSRGVLPYFDEAAIGRVLRMEGLIQVMEQALIDFSLARVIQPVRTVIPIERHSALMGIMPVVHGDVMGAKLVTVYPNNAATGLPTHLGLIALFRSDTGEPLAILDGRLITEMRTAAVSAVAARLLASPNARKLAILGSGVQARAHAKALRLVRSCDDIRIWSRDLEHARQCATEISGVAMSAEDAVRDADIVVTVTHSSDPVLRGAWLRPGVLVIAVGAVGPTRREVDSDTMQGAVIVDSREAAMKESGDVLLAGATIYAELGELLADVKPKPDAAITAFKSLGLAVEDIAAARFVLEALGTIEKKKR